MSESEAGAKPELVDSHGRTLNVVTRATRDGASDAREAAERAWAATTLFTSRFVYTTCYTLSYGIVFPSIFVACAIPKNNVAVRGLIDGANAAITKVDEVRLGSIESASDPVEPSLAPA